MRNIFKTPQGKLVVGITIAAVVLVIVFAVYNTFFA